MHDISVTKIICPFIALSGFVTASPSISISRHDIGQASQGFVSIITPQKTNTSEIEYVVKDSKIVILPCHNEAFPTYDSNMVPIIGGAVALERGRKVKNIEKLETISLLGENWNLNGAAPFSESLVNRMRDIIETIHYQPDIFPTACDSIQFEYEKPSGEYLEFELYEDKVGMFLVDENGNESTDTFCIDIDKINEVVDSFYGECIR